MKYFILILLTLALLTSSTQAQTKPSVNLIWSADTHSPPFYAGHSIATPQSKIKVLALVDSWAQAPSNLEYTWKRNGQLLLKSSGFGQNILTFSAGKAGETERINVAVSDPAQTTRQEQTITIPVTNPSISIYRNESLTGINYAQAIDDNLILGQPEINLFAEPYFFPKTDVTSGKIDYRWRLNDQRVVPDPLDSRLITFAAPSGTTGQNTITINAESLNTVFQSAKKQFQITFGGTQNFNF
ncbi:hypothetical protein IT398_01190 [Candidatus Nomurabacteria bacterium]|nr:hypothetical protein [Candidatus Nomurabacteria bacterium]